MDLVGEGQHAVQLNGDQNIEAFRDDNSVVIRIRVVVHTQGAWPNSPLSDNHVSVYLLVGNGRSVRINMATEENDTRGVLVWSQLGYELSNSSIIHFDYSVIPSLKVGHVYQALRSVGYHRYRFSGGGSGCRFWIITLMQLLVTRSWVHQNVLTHVSNALAFQYTRTSNTPPRPIQIKQGQFLSEEDWQGLWEDTEDSEDSEDN